jgi:hypothetical protein
MTIQPDGVAADDCYRCGYDLRGIASDQACPECGLLAERSRRVSDELHDSRPRWLRRLARGVWLMLVALVVLIGFSIAMDRVRDWILITSLRPNLLMISNGGFVPRSWWRSSQFWEFLIELFPLVGPGIGAATFFLGVLMLTSREQYGPADHSDRRRRLLLRALCVVPLLGVIADGTLMQLNQKSPYGNYIDWRWLDFALPLCVLTASVPIPALLFHQLRSLAKRARSAHLAEHCAIVGVGMSSAVLYGAVILILFEFAESLGLDPNWQARSSVSLVLMLLCTLSASLFVLWSVYLLIRFAIAFHSAARQLGRKWKRDDRAASG